MFPPCPEGAKPSDFRDFYLLGSPQQYIPQQHSGAVPCMGDPQRHPQLDPQLDLQLGSPAGPAEQMLDIYIEHLFGRPSEAAEL